MKEYFYVRGSSALSVCPFEKCLKSINSGGTNSPVTAVLRSCELRAAVCAPEAPDSGSRARQAPIPRISLPFGDSLRTQGLDLLYQQVQSLSPTWFQKKKKKKQKSRNEQMCCVHAPRKPRLMAPPVAPLLSAVFSPPLQPALSSDTSVCATVCVWKVCVQRVFE